MRTGQGFAAACFCLALCNCYLRGQSLGASENRAQGSPLLIFRTIIPVCENPPLVCLRASNTYLLHRGLQAIPDFVPRCCFEVTDGGGLRSSGYTIHNCFVKNWQTRKVAYGTKRTGGFSRLPAPYHTRRENRQTAR